MTLFDLRGHNWGKRVKNGHKNCAEWWYLRKIEFLTSVTSVTSVDLRGHIWGETIQRILGWPWKLFSMIRFEKLSKIEFLTSVASFDLRGRIWGHPVPPKSRSLSNFGLMLQPWKRTPSMSFSMSKSGMASFDLGGRGGWPWYVKNHFYHLVRSHAKNQQPGLETVAVKRVVTRTQTPGTNLQLYIKMCIFLDV